MKNLKGISIHRFIYKIVLRNATLKKKKKTPKTKHELNSEYYNGIQKSLNFFLSNSLNNSSSDFFNGTFIIKKCIY